MRKNSPEPVHTLQGECPEPVFELISAQFQPSAQSGWESIRTGSAAKVFLHREYAVKLFPALKGSQKTPLISVFTDPVRRILKKEQRLRSAGFNVPETIALLRLGDQPLLVTERVQSPTLLSLLKDELSFRQKQQLVNDLADLIARFHDEGFTHGDLNAYNLLCSESPDGHWSFTLMDNEQGKRWWLLAKSRALKDLSQLNYLEPGLLSQCRRLAFLQTYLNQRKRLTKGEWREWWHALNTLYQTRKKRKQHKQQA